MKLDRMKAIVIAELGMGKPPPFSYHLRFWNVSWVGRAPTDALGMGFWASTTPMPVAEFDASDRAYV